MHSHVRKLQMCDGAFANCCKLSRVEFETNSKLQTIEKKAFSFSNLASILIPSRTKLNLNAYAPIVRGPEFC